MCCPISRTEFTCFTNLKTGFVNNVRGAQKNMYVYEWFSKFFNTKNTYY